MTWFRAAAVAAAFLALPVAASADPGPAPWDGGREVVTPFEAQAAAIASEIAERPVRMHCNGGPEWAALAAVSGFEAGTVWGYVTFTFGASGWTPGDEAELSESACRHADAFWSGGAAAKPPRTCRVGTRVEKRVEQRWRTVRVKTPRSVVAKRKRVPVQVRVEVPVVALCPGYIEERLFALQTLAHESVHLAGVDDEAVAECYGVQLLSWVASSLGAPDRLARQMAADYWTGYYLVARPGTVYFDPECRDGGMFDLAPDRAGWPAPDPIRAAGSFAIG